jgi:hypothetical protein
LAHDNLSNTYVELKKYWKLFNFQLQALFERLKSIPRGHMSFAGSFAQLSRPLIFRGCFEFAEVSLQTALDIFSAILPSNHPIKASCLLYYGDLRYKQRCFRQALGWYM